MAFPSPGMHAQQQAMRNAAVGAYLASRRSRGGGGMSGCCGCVWLVLVLLFIAAVVVGVFAH